MESTQFERLFTCTYCSRTFRRLEHLQRHTRIHTNEKPFTCHCGASFTRRDLLKRHSRIAHPSSPAQAYNAEDAYAGDVALGSIAQTLLSEDSQGDTAIVEGSLTDEYYAKRTLRLPLPPEYRHVENAFRDESCGSTLHNLLQDLLGNAKPVGDRSALDRSISVGSVTHTHAVTSKARSEDGQPGILHTEYMSLNEPWRDPGLRHTAGLRQQLMQSLLRHGRSAELLPSAQSLSRYVRAFMSGFHERYPILHTQTMPLTELPADIAFSLLALGADLSHEFKAALYLFESAVAVSSTVLGSGLSATTEVFATQSTKSPVATSGVSGENSWLDDSSHALCVMLLLTVFGLQNRSLRAMQVMWSVQGIFAYELRQSLKSLPDDSEDESIGHPVSWSEWATGESQRRVKHAAFCVLNLVSMTFDFPAAVPFAQLRVAVPCSAEEWRASSADEWAKVHGNTLAKPILLSGLVESLFAGGRRDTISSSVLGECTVLHAILQKIQTLRQALSVIPEDISTQTESSLSSFANSPPMPPNPSDTAVYLLAGLAHLHLHLGIAQSPPSRDDTQLAAWLRDFPVPDRHPKWLPVLRSAIYMLDTQMARGLGVDKHPFDIGVDPQAFLCVMEFPIFLIKWLLLMVGSVHEQPATEDEQQIAKTAADVVVEAGRCIELGTPCDYADWTSIATGIARMMTSLCQRSPKAHVSIVGEAYGIYATMLLSGGGYLDHQLIADLPAYGGDMR